MTTVVETVGLTKRYGRHGRGVIDLDLAIEQGEVFGFLGPNGAGKTTTLRLLLDLIHPTAGRVSLFGLDAHRRRAAVHRRVGYLPGDLRLFDRLTGREQLAALSAMGGVETGRRVRELAERLDLRLDVPVHALSRGNRQKVGLVQAFAHDPDLLVLDEPTGGLDPIVQQTFAELVREAVARGGTVLLSSHQLDEVQRLADRVAIVREGRLVVVEDVGVLRARAVRRVDLHLAGGAPVAAFTALPGVRVLGADGDRLRLSVEGSMDALVKEAARHEVIDLTTHESDLDDVFLRYYRDADGTGPS